MGYKDDATGKVYARFYEYEGTVPALDSLKRYIGKYGIPQSVYLDKHTTYKSTKVLEVAEQLAGRKESLSQFGRACEELGVKVIYAHSPQAKGRIERQFRTFQHRLMREMRLAGTKTLEEANKVLEGYLPKYNRRFEVPAANKADLHRSVPRALNLKSIFSVKEKRVVRNDWTIPYLGKFYQILESVQAKQVVVERRLDGTLGISHEGRSLRFKAISTPAKKPKKPLLPKGLPWNCMRRKVGPRHPWKPLTVEPN